jgi:hypothetical protein
MGHKLADVLESVRNYVFISLDCAFLLSQNELL